MYIKRKREGKRKKKGGRIRRRGHTKGKSKRRMGDSLRSIWKLGRH